MCPLGCVQHVVLRGFWWNVVRRADLKPIETISPSYLLLAVQVHSTTHCRFYTTIEQWSPHLLKRAIIVRYHFLVLGSIGSCNTEGDYCIKNKGDYCIKNKQTKPSIFLVILHDHPHHRRHDFFWQNSFGYRNTSLFIRWSAGGIKALLKRCRLQVVRGESHRQLSFKAGIN